MSMFDKIISKFINRIPVVEDAEEIPEPSLGEKAAMEILGTASNEPTPILVPGAIFVGYNQILATSGYTGFGPGAIIPQFNAVPLDVHPDPIQDAVNKAVDQMRG